MSYLVGEKGPEVFTPRASGQITTHGTLDRLASIGAKAFGGAMGGRGMPALATALPIVLPALTAALPAAAAPMADLGRAVVEGAGEPVAPTPAQVAKAKPEARERAEKRPRGDFHGGTDTWHIHGGDPASPRQQVESIFDDLLRQYESDQRGSLSD